MASFLASKSFSSAKCARLRVSLDFEDCDPLPGVLDNFDGVDFADVGRLIDFGLQLFQSSSINLLGGLICLEGVQGTSHYFLCRVHAVQR